MRLLRKRSGFTLMEGMVSIAILGILSAGLYNMIRDGFYMWNMGTARMTLNAEARLTMVAIKKIIQESQGATITISRFNANQPANSYISAVITESAFITSTMTRCGCGTSTDTIVVGGTGAPVEIYQYGNFLRMTYPFIDPGTDITDSAEVEANTHYKTMTISANCESLMFSFIDSKKGDAISVGARFSKRAWNNRPPITVYMKETIMVKRMHSAGYYGN